MAQQEKRREGRPYVYSAKAKKKTYSLDPEIVNWIKQQAKINGVSKSSLVNSIIRNKML